MTNQHAKPKRPSSGSIMAQRTVRFAAGLALALPSLVQGTTPVAQREVAEAYLARMIDVWEGDASLADIEELGELFAEDVIYGHPRAGIKMEGRRVILDAMARFLGASRSPRVSGVEVLAGTRVVVLGFDLSMEIRDGEAWVPIERRQIVVLQTEDGLITGISDHW